MAKRASFVLMTANGGRNGHQVLENFLMAEMARLRHARYSFLYQR